MQTRDKKKAMRRKVSAFLIALKFDPKLAGKTVYQKADLQKMMDDEDVKHYAAITQTPNVR